MAKDDRLFAPFPIEMDEHPKIIGLSDRAFRAVIEATFYSRRMLSDGFLDRRVVLRKWGQEAADELSSNDPERPSWIPVEHGWQIHDFEKHHPLRAEIQAKRDAISELNSAKGKRSAEARRAKAQPNGNRIEPSFNRNEPEWSQPPTESNSETETETETSKELRTTSSPTAMESAFDEAWAHWPKKVERKKAFEQFKKSFGTRYTGTLDGLVEWIVRFGDAYAATTERQFVPALGVWLNGERWTDELPQAQAPASRPGALTKTEKNLSVVARYAAMEQAEQKGISQ